MQINWNEVDTIASPINTAAGRAECISRIPATPMQCKYMAVLLFKIGKDADHIGLTGQQVILTTRDASEIIEDLIKEGKDGICSTPSKNDGPDMVSRKIAMSRLAKCGESFAEFVEKFGDHAEYSWDDVYDFDGEYEPTTASVPRRKT